MVQASVAPSTWLNHGNKQVVVWLIGHSYLFWAARRAEIRPGGRNLGFTAAALEWKGIRGMSWWQVLPEAVEISRRDRGPLVLVIHAAGNDLCRSRLSDLMTLMKADISRIRGFFNEVVLVWSEIVPRVVWQGARDPAAIERARRVVNTRISRFVRSLGGVVIRHRQLEGDNRSLMRPDGIHLNEIGLDIFLSGLQDGIDQALFLLSGGRSSV
ncbi:hypothetical protein GDO86_004498 [Hymenochirus boettgeri]|uniref:SGNH hydrolase-type esterase domain-containing protein n=1 Tax=Hymenochirus boettgeri TaxID=247094 RepID=A0A8T2K5E6_9PIPI|nr:hypothetical protein GDO86_011117 [Hymenochirus boettgeri]KAG8452725.1 hypothetical protein GDO86_004498 [Hymenochirus boettgeri]